MEDSQCAELMLVNTDPPHSRYPLHAPHHDPTSLPQLAPHLEELHQDLGGPRQGAVPDDQRPEDEGDGLKELEAEVCSKGGGGQKEEKDVIVKRKNVVCCVVFGKKVCCFSYYHPTVWYFFD